MTGKRIREIRKEAKLTQQDLSDGIITRSYLSQIEKGIVQPSFEVLEKLSRKLNCSVDDFFKIVEDKGLLLSQLKKDIKTAEMHLNNNLFDKVEELIQKKEYLNHKELDSYYKGILLWVHGKFYEHKKDYNYAITLFEKSIAVLEEENYKEELLRYLDSLGYVNSQINQNETALYILNKAYQMMIYEQISGMVRISILVNLGIVHGKLNEYYSAINFLKEARNLNDNVGTYYKSGEIFMVLGICNMELNRYKDAKKSYERALKFFKLNENKDFEAGTYTNQKEYNQAELHLKTAIKIYTTIETKARDLMNAQIGLSRVYYLQENFDKSNSLCYDILRFKDINKYTAEAFELLGDIFQKQSDLNSALSHYDKAKKMLIELSIPYKNINKKIADVYSTIEEYQKAIDYYKDCF